MTSIPMSPFLNNPKWRNPYDPDQNPTVEVSPAPRTETETFAENRATETKRTIIADQSKPVASTESERNMAAFSGNAVKTRPISAISPNTVDVTQPLGEALRPTVSSSEMPQGAARLNSAQNPELLVQKKLSTELGSSAFCRVSDEEDAEPDFLAEEISMLTEENMNPLPTPTERPRKRSLSHIHRPRRPSTPRFMEDAETENDKDTEDDHENGSTLPDSQLGSSVFVPLFQPSDSDGSDEEKQCKVTLIPKVVVDAPTKLPEITSIVSDYGNAMDFGQAEALPGILKEAFSSLAVFEKAASLAAESEATPMALMEVFDVPSRNPCLSDIEEYEDTVVTSEEERVTLQQSDASHSSGVMAAAPEQTHAEVLFSASEKTSAMSINVEEPPVIDDHLFTTSSRNSLTNTEDAQYMVVAEHSRDGFEDHWNPGDRLRAEVERKDMTTMESDARSNFSLDEGATVDEREKETVSLESERALEIRRDMECEDTGEIVDDEITSKTDSEELETGDIRSHINEQSNKDAEVSSDEARMEWQLADGREEPGSNGDMIGRGCEMKSLMEIRHTLRKSVDMEEDYVIPNGILKRRNEEHRTDDSDEDRLVHDEDITEKEEDNETENEEINLYDGIAAGLRRNSCQLTEEDHDDYPTASNYATELALENNAENDLLEVNCIAKGSANETVTSESLQTYSDRYTVADSCILHAMLDTTAVNLLVSVDNPTSVEHGVAREYSTKPSYDVNAEVSSNEDLPNVIDVSANILEPEEVNSSSFTAADSATEFKFFSSPVQDDSSSDGKSLTQGCKENSNISDDLSAQGREERIASDDFLDLMLEPLSDDILTTAECPVYLPSTFQPSNDHSSGTCIDVDSTITNLLLNRSLIVTADLEEETGVLHQNNTQFSLETRNNPETKNIQLMADDYTEISTADKTEPIESDEHQIPSLFEPSPNADFFLTSDMVLTPPAPQQTLSSKHERASSPQPSKLEMYETNSFAGSNTDFNTPFTSESWDNRDDPPTESTKLLLLNEGQKSPGKRTSDRTRSKETDYEMMSGSINNNSVLDSDGNPDLQTGINVGGNGRPTSMDHLQLLHSEAAPGGKFFLTSDEIDPMIENLKNTEVQIEFCAEEVPDRQIISADEKVKNLPVLTPATTSSDSDDLLDPETRDSVSESEGNCLRLNPLGSAFGSLSLPANETSKPVSSNFQANIPGDLKGVCANTTDPRSTLLTTIQDIHTPIIPENEIAQLSVIENSFSINEISDLVNSIKSSAVPCVAENNRFADLAPSRRNVKPSETNESHTSASETSNTLSGRNTEVANVEQCSIDSLTKQTPVLNTFDSLHSKSNEFEKRSEIVVGLDGPDITSSNPDRPAKPDDESDQPSISLESLQNSLVFKPFREHPGTVDDIILPLEDTEGDSKSSKCCDVTQAVSSSKQRVQPVFLTLSPTDTHLHVNQKQVDFDSDQGPPLPESAPPTAEAMPSSPFWFQLTDELKFSLPEGDRQHITATDINGNKLLDQDLTSVHKDPDAVDEDDRETERTETTSEANPSETLNTHTTFSSCVRVQCDSRGISKDLENAVEERTDPQKKLSIRFLQGIGSNIHWNLDEEDHLGHETHSDPLTKTPGDNSAVLKELNDIDDVHDIAGVGKHAPSPTLSQDDIGRQTTSCSIPIAILSYTTTAVETVSEMSSSVVSISPEVTTSVRTVRRTRSNQVNDQ